MTCKKLILNQVCVKAVIRNAKVMIIVSEQLTSGKHL